ncbi:MAG: hypothetical protein ACI97A_002444, partial [Planctomycetota bacterium]
MPNLQETLNILRHALDSLPHQIAIIDSKGAIVAVNRSWDKFYVDCETGESPRHWIGMNYFAQGFGKLEPSNL